MNFKVKLPRIVDISAVIFLIFYIFMLRGLNDEIYITLSLVFLWLFIAFVTDLNSFFNAMLHKNMILVWVYLIYSFIISVFFTGMFTSLGYITGHLLLFIGVLAFYYYKYKFKAREFKNMVKIILAIWVYYCIKALFLYSKYSISGRDIVSHKIELAIGGAYGLAYGTAILGVYIFSGLLLNNFKNRYKRYMIIITIISFVLVLDTGSTITLIAMICGLLFNIYLHINVILKNSIPKVIFNMVFSIFLLIILLNLNYIGAGLISIAPDNLFGSRVELIGVKLKSGENIGTLAARLSLYKKSIKSFLEYPLFGTSFNRGFQDISMIGNHSELFDSLAKYGLIGSLMYFLIFIFAIIQERIKNGHLFSGAYILVLIIMFTLNPFHSPQANFVLFFIIPSFGLIVDSK